MKALYTHGLDPRDPATADRDTWHHAARFGNPPRNYKSAEESSRAGRGGDDFTLTTAIALSPSTSGARAGRRTPSPATVDSLSPTLSLKLHQQQASRAAQTRVRSA